MVTDRIETEEGHSKPAAAESCAADLRSDGLYARAAFRPDLGGWGVRTLPRA